MKLGSLMDPREERRGLRGHAFIFDPVRGAVPIDDDLEGVDEETGEEAGKPVDDGPAAVNYDEPEPDDPDA